MSRKFKIQLLDRSPLFGHGIRYSWESRASDFPSRIFFAARASFYEIYVFRFSMLIHVSSHRSWRIYSGVCRFQRWQSFEPQASALFKRISEHPRMDSLGRLKKRVYMSYRIFNANALDRRIVALQKKFGRHFAQFVAPGFVPMFSSRIRQIRARRVRDKQIPSFIKLLEQVALDMERARIIGSVQIAAPCVMPEFSERFANPSGIFASYQNAHFRSF